MISPKSNYLQEAHLFNTSDNMVIYNKKYIFGLPSSFGHRAPTTVGIFLSEGSNKAIFCFDNEKTFGKHLKIWAGCQESQPCD